MDYKKASLLMMMVLDGTIDELDRQKLQDHIDECDHCRQELSLLQESIDLIDSLEEIEPPRELEDLVLSKIDIHKYTEESTESSKESSKVTTWILRVAVIFSMIVGILSYLAFNDPDTIKQTIISVVIKVVNFAVLTLPNILLTIENNFFIIMGIGIGILITLLSSIIMLAMAEYYIVEKLKINFRGGVKS